MSPWMRSIGSLALVLVLPLACDWVPSSEDDAARSPSAAAEPSDHKTPAPGPAEAGAPASEVPGTAEPKAPVPGEPTVGGPASAGTPAPSSGQDELTPTVEPSAPVPPGEPSPPAQVQALAIHEDVVAEGWALRVELSLRDGEPALPLDALFLETACRRGGDAWLELSAVPLRRGTDPATPTPYAITPFAASRLAAAPERCQLRLLRGEPAGTLASLAERCFAAGASTEGPCADFTPPPPDDTPLRVVATHARRHDGRVRWDWVIRRGREPLPHAALDLVSGCMVGDREVHAHKAAAKLGALRPGDYLFVSVPQSTAGPLAKAVIERCDLYLQFPSPGMFERAVPMTQYCFVRDALHEGSCKTVDPPPAPKLSAACAPLAAARGNDDGQRCDEKLSRWYPADTLDGLVACMVAGPYQHGCFEALAPPRTEPAAKEACRRIDHVLRKEYGLSRDDLMDHWDGVSRCTKLLSAMTEDGRKAIEECMTGVCEAEVGCAQSIYECAEGLHP